MSTIEVRMTRPTAPDWGGEETDEGAQIYHHAWDSEGGDLRLWVGPYSGGLTDGWAVTVAGPDDTDVVMHCSTDQIVEWATMVIAAVEDSRSLAAEIEAEKARRDATRIITCCMDCNATIRHGEARDAGWLVAFGLDPDVTFCPTHRAEFEAWRATQEAG